MALESLFDRHDGHKHKEQKNLKLGGYMEVNLGTYIEPK